MTGPTFDPSAGTPNSGAEVPVRPPATPASSERNNIFDFVREMGQVDMGRLLLCRQLVQKRQFARASHELDAMLAENPSLVVVHYLRSLVLIAAGDLWAARASLQQAIAGGYVRSIVYILLGHLEYELGNTDLALCSAEKAVELDAQDAQGHQLRGSLLAQLDRFEESASAFESAVRLNPQSRALRFRWAQVLLRIGQQTQAKQVVIGALRLNPFDVQSRLILGTLLWATGALDSAVAEYCAARVMNLPGNSRPQACLGQLLLELGRNDEAEESLLDAVKINPKDFNSFVALGELYSLQGDLFRAREAFASAIKIDQSVAHIREKIARCEAACTPSEQPDDTSN